MDTDVTEKADQPKTRLSAAEAWQSFMLEMRDGAAITELGEDLRELVEAVRQTGNAAELIITFKFDLKDAENRGTVRVRDKIKSKRPRHSHQDTEFMITADGVLAVVPPEQMKMNGVN